MSKFIEYKKNEFCKDVHCIWFNGKECNHVDIRGCSKSAKEFHKWLKKNDFKIIKTKQQKQLGHPQHLGAIVKDE